MAPENKPLSEKEDENDELDSILSTFKFWGPYYLRLMPFLMFSCLTNAIYCMNYVFAAGIVDYRCQYPECDTLSDAKLNLAPYLALENKCYKYLVVDDNGTCNIDSFNISIKSDCKEWVYDEPNSFVATFNLGCQDWKRSLVGTVHSIGYMLGLLLLGPVSDKVGRKKLIIFTGITGGLAGLARSWSESYWTYITFEFLEALLGDTYSSNYMLGVEMVAKQNRAFFSPLMVGTMSIGGMLTALVAWLFPNWRSFLRIVYGPSIIIFILYIFFLDESVRWLLIKGKNEEAKAIIRKAAKISNLHIDNEKLNKIQREETVESMKLTALFKITFSSKTLMLRFLACACAWITVTFNKYGLLINSVALEGDRYMNYAITAFADLPASILLIYLLKRFKRKIPLVFSFLMTGSFCIIQSLVPKGYVPISTALFFSGKFMSALATGIVYLYTTELFPTYTRNTMHALCSAIGRVGSILAPQTTLLIKYWSGIPSVIVGGLSLTTALIVMMMPETAEDVLPDTVHQAEALGMKVKRSDHQDVVQPLL